MEKVSYSHLYTVACYATLVNWPAPRRRACATPVLASHPALSLQSRPSRPAFRSQDRSSLLSFRSRLQEIREGFAPAFWVANVSEIFERLAYYGAFSSLANYLHESLKIPTEQTGSLAGLFGGMVWFLA